MNWDDLRYFLALARAGTVSAAGRDLEVKHTTVSRRIKSLEQQLGTRLFDHLAGGYTLNQAGENLFQNALAMEEQAHAIDRQVFGLDAQLQGDLMLTASHDVFSRLVIPQLGQFRDAYPGINLQLLSTTGLADLGARQADIALRLTPKPPDYLIGKMVMPLGIGLYASRRYLEHYPQPQHLVLWNDEVEWPQWAQQNFPGAQVAIRANDVTTLLACLSHNIGITMLPCYIGDHPDAGLHRLDLPLAASTWGVWVLSHVDLRATARVRVCREFLIDIIEQQRSLISGTASRYWSN
jgi:DNA-binding transcriptional LysR family regulator